MPRTNANGELWDALDEFGRIIDSTGGSSGITTASTAAKGATSLTVSASSGLSTGTYIRIGPTGGAQLAYIESISTADVLTLRSQLAEAVSTGETVFEQARTILGCTTDAGVQTNINTDITTVNSACQRNAYAHLLAHTDAVVEVGILNISWENLLATVGVAESNLSGAGTVADPTVAYWLPDEWDSVKPIHFWARGTLKDGTIVEVQFWDCDIDPKKSLAFARGQEAPLGLTFFPRVEAWFKPAA